MTDQKTMKSNCPDCGPSRKCDVLFEKSIHDDDGTVWTQTTHYVLECRGCEKIFHQRDFTCSEDMYPVYGTCDGEDIWEYSISEKRWPSPSKRKKPEWFDGIGNIDFDLYLIMQETYTAFENDMPVLSAIGLRTVFDRATEKLDVDPSLSFEKKLNELECLKMIGSAEKASLSALVDAGSAAAHRAWRPKSSQLSTMADIIENFLHRTFILGQQSKSLARSVPARPSRRRKAEDPMLHQETQPQLDEG